VSPADEELLGAYIHPANLTWARANTLDTKNMGWYMTNTNIGARPETRDVLGCVVGGPAACAATGNFPNWTGPAGTSFLSYPEQVVAKGSFFSYALSLPLLGPARIAWNKSWSWDAASVADIVARNPGLTSSDFVTRVDHDRAFVINVASVMIPPALAPTDTRKMNYLRVQYTPLYSGIPVKSGAYTFHGLNYSECQGASLGDTVAPSSQASVDLGGFIESFAFDTVMTSSATVDGSVVVEGGPTLFPLSEAMTSSGASVMGTPLTWQNSSAYSGTTCAAYTSLQDYVDIVPRQRVQSPGALQRTNPQMLVADGYWVDNSAIIDLVQRRVDKIVSVNSNAFPADRFWNLPSVSEWNVSEHLNDSNQSTSACRVFDAVIGALFGIEACQRYLLSEDATYVDMTQAQVFESADFVPLVAKLQEGFDGGGLPGAPIAVQNVTTVENTLYGIAAGHPIELTLVYLSRWAQWEDQLPQKTLDHLNASTYNCGSRNGRSEWPANMLVPGCNSAANWTVNILTQQFTAMILENHEHFQSVFPATS